MYNSLACYLGCNLYMRNYFCSRILIRDIFIFHYTVKTTSLWYSLIVYEYISYFDDRYRPNPSIHWHNKLLLNDVYIFCHWWKITTILRHVGSKLMQILIINVHEQYRKNCMNCNKKSWRNNEHCIKHRHLITMHHMHCLLGILETR